RGDVDAVDRDRASARMDEPRHHHERGRLAGAARSQECEKRSGGDGHGDVADSHHQPEELGQPLQTDLGAGPYPFWSSHCDQRSLTFARLSAHHLPFWRNALALCSGLEGSRAATSAGMDLKACRFVGPYGINLARLACGSGWQAKSMKRWALSALFAPFS